MSSTAARESGASHSPFRALLTYFVLAFLIPWGVVLAVVALARGSGTGESGDIFYLPVFVAMALAPACAGLLMTATARGTGGLKRLLLKIIDLRALARPEVALVLLAPTAAALVLAGFSLRAEPFLPGIVTAPDRPALLAMGIGGGVVVGLLEETGWTGFATKELLARRGVVAVGLILGPIHGIWHLAAGYWSEGTMYGAYYAPYFLVAWIAGLTVLRLLVVWLYHRTGSLLLAALTHAGYTGGLLILWPTNTLPLQNIAWTGCFVLLFGAAVVALLRRDSRRGAGDGATGGP